ncbi:MAG: SUF system Fe-S cluster assembly protein [Blastocatellia bacterium]|nr:SUF system Fe-S cluster assembly protein [Blastocatellia bacterium]MCS7156706.1 SUF system Fe-S cluster assembly protein [Blastocatellia bacterium]MCX7751552.1 SUF system Fe-S cluster assembly protein [Blastocatellia bacterium]MDW8168652.1 SUF system Fe-S cluster assembly protein [Acidobacteriota bacterium]MDW8256547.1 SUF system Fe-S cluster assembly protein [Acidobacteriota bacterium]
MEEIRPTSPSEPVTTPAESNASADSATSATSTAELREKIIAVLRTCYDPEIPVNIYDLGLIYDIEITPEGAVTVRMTLTAPGCPVAFSLPLEVEAKLRGIEGVTDARVELVWDPPWTPDRMSETARLQLGWW